MRFTSTRPGGAGSSDLWESTRPDRDGAWATPTPLTELNTEEAECCGTTDEADRLMVYASRRGGLTASDLFVATRASTTEPWGGVTAAAELNTADTESNPHVREEGRLLVFDSDRPGGAGLRDLYFSQRAAVSEPWGEPVRLTELASPGNDRDAWLSLDGRRIYFTSDRTGDFEIYVASR
jgi:Tol biopolymer transport system component